jgi:NADPH-dependent glutamate synthase beta subunit-like oxidoreductase
MALMIPKDPYREYDAAEAARMVLSCLDCDPAPCTLNCPQHADIRAVMQLTRQAACAGLPLVRWFRSPEEIAAAAVSDQICDAYN